MRSAPPLLLLLALLTGCGATSSSMSTTNLKVTEPLDPTLMYLRSYGDSISYGYNLQDRSLAFPSLIAEYNHLTSNFKNYAHPGDQACDISPKQIFSRSEDPSLALKGLFTVLIGGNDADVKLPGPYEAVFNLCQQAAIAWVAIPLEFKTRGSSLLVTTSGPTHFDTTNVWNSQVTEAAGASVTFPLQLAATSPVYVWYRIIDGNPGVFTYAVDGKVVGVLSTSTDPAIATQNFQTDSLALLRIPSVPAGPHTFTFTQLTAGLAGAGIVAVGAPPTGDPALRLRVLVGTIPFELDHTNEKNNLPYIADIISNVTLLAADGLDVELVDSRKYMTGTSADMTDPHHPNALGHQEIFKAFEDTLK